MKIKVWLNILTAAALVAIIGFAWHDIWSAFSRMRDLNLWILVLMIPAQFMVFFALAKLFQHFFLATDTHLSLRRLMPPMIELNFVNHVFPSGGVSGFSYLTFRLRKFGVSTAKSTLAQLARFAFTFIAFIPLLVLALVILAIEGRTSSLVVLAASAVTTAIICSTAVVVFVIGSPTRIDVFTAGLVRAINRLVRSFHRHKKGINPDRVRQTFMELHEDYRVLRRDPQKIRRVIWWALVTNIAEVALLYIVFVAHGEWVNPGAVVIAFTIANLAALVAVLPGGVGVYEPLMSAVLVAGGIPAGLALSATLVYRVIAMLLSLLTGYVLYQKALHHGDITSP